MYTILYKENHNDKKPKLIHSVNRGNNQVLSGELEQVLNGIDTFDFAMGIDNAYYGQTRPILGLIDVFNDYDDELEFRGRILAQSAEMDKSNRFMQHIECVSLLSYLHDSGQGYRKIPNTGNRDFLSVIINHHNASVEAHKRFILGKVTVESSSDVPFRYIGYQTTFETIKTHVLDKIGGVIILRHETDGMYLDWLAESNVGEHIDSPIRWGDNILSAQREIDFSNIITRLMPIGADLEVDLSDEERANEEAYGTAVVRPRVMIPSVNNNKDHLDDPALIEQFGILEKPMDWPEIDDPQTLKERGQQFMNSQRAFLASWTVETAELWLLDKRFKKYKVGNWHPIINPPISGIEELQVVKKRLNIMDNRQVQIDVGADKQSLTSYQLQVQEAGKSIEALKRKQADSSKDQQTLNENLSTMVEDYNTLSENSATKDELEALLQEIEDLRQQIGGTA